MRATGGALQKTTVGRRRGGIFGTVPERSGECPPTHQRKNKKTMNPSPSIAGLSDIEALERVPLEQRDLPSSTYELLQRSAQRHGQRIALSCLLHGSAAEEPLRISYAELFARVTQTANALHRLGLESHQAVSFLLPNLPQTHYVIWGGEAAGIVNAINPLLEPEHIAELIRASNTRVLVTLAPFPGTDLWQKVAGLRAAAGAVRDRRGRSGQPVAGAAARGAQGPARAAAGGRAGLRYADRRLPGRPPGERTGDPSGRRRFLFPHRRHHRHAEAGAAQPLQRGGDGRDHGPERRLRGGRRAALRPAAVPRQRRDGYRPGALPSRRPGAPGRAPGLPQSDPDPGLLEAGGALPGHQLQWCADHLRGVAAGPQRWPRPVQPAFRPVRRGADAGGADPPVRGAYRAQGDRRLRPHRRHLRHQLQPAWRAPAGFDRPAPAVLPGEGRGARRRGQLPARCRAERGGQPLPEGPDGVQGLPATGPEPRYLGRRWLVQYRRPRSYRRGRLHLAHRAQQGPDHSRWPQHRPTDDRRSAAPASGRGPGGGGGQAGRQGRRAAGGVYPAQARRQRQRGRAAGTRQPPRTGARGGAQGCLADREHAGHRGGQDLRRRCAWTRSAGCWRRKAGGSPRISAWRWSPTSTTASSPTCTFPRSTKDAGRRWKSCSAATR